MQRSLEDTVAAAGFMNSISVRRFTHECVYENSSSDSDVHAVDPNIDGAF